jgi:uncharacterized membrane protein
MTVEHPAAARYLAALDAALADLDARERIEVVQEIGQHLRDAQADGKPLDEALTALGPADALARAYRVELLLNPKDGRRRGRNRWLRIASVIAIGSLPTFIILVVLFALGLSFTVSGMMVFAAGIWVASAGALPDWVAPLGVPPSVAIAMGIPLTAIGIAAFAGMVWYLSFTARLVRQIVPPARARTV